MIGFRMEYLSSKIPVAQKINKSSDFQKLPLSAVTAWNIYAKLGNRQRRDFQTILKYLSGVCAPHKLTFPATFSRDVYISVICY